MNLPVDTLSDEIEPYLLREQLLVRTPRGRMATARTYQHLGKPRPNQADQGGLFDEKSDPTGR
jgi:Holliday junction DNA helicase RuvB